MTSNYPRLLFVIVMLSMLSACQTFKPTQSWPSELPDRQIFVDGFLQKRNLTEADPQILEAHLIWVKRFYQGTILYPNGWNKATSRFLETVKQDRDRSELRRRMRQLGIAIACEWAQDNGTRNIDSTNVAVWGSALREAASLNDHKAYISKVEEDVAKLITGKMHRTEIEFERYYPELDYDNF